MMHAAVLPMTDPGTTQEPDVEDRADDDPEGGQREAPRTVIDNPVESSLEDRRVAELLEHSIDVPVLASAVGAQEPADAADTLEGLDESEAADVLEEMDLDDAAIALSHMVAPLAVSVLEDIVQQDPVFAARLLAEMSADDAVDLLQLPPDGTVRSLLRHMSVESRVVIEPLLAFDPQTAGGMMEAEVLKVFGDLTVRDAVELVRTTQATHAALLADHNHLVSQHRRAEAQIHLLEGEVDALRGNEMRLLPDLQRWLALTR